MAHCSTARRHYTATSPPQLVHTATSNADQHNTLIYLLSSVYEHYELMTLLDPSSCHPPMEILYMEARVSETTIGRQH